MARTEETHEPGRLNRRGVFRGAATLGGLSAAGLLLPAGAFRAQAAELRQSPETANALAEQTRKALRWAGPAPAEWVAPRAGVDHNVVVVGGGQTGVSISYWLGRKGVGQILTIDQAEPGQAGIWRTIARMRQLNSPKNASGPGQNNAALSFRGWYETINGPGAFDALDHVPRLIWADYLAWFQQVTDTQVRYRTRLLEIEPVGDILRLHLETEGVRRTETTRKLVLATGYLGGGGPNVPGIVRALPAHLWTHTSSPIAPKALTGKAVAVLGAGASAFDAAGAALEDGAAEVRLFSRDAFINYRSTPPPPNSTPILGLNYALPDDVRWRNQLLRNRTVATVLPDELDRVVNSDRFYLHVNSPWSGAAVAGNGKVSVQSLGKTYQFDHVIAGTGYRTDVSTLPELSRIHGSIALWRDRYKPAPGEENIVGGYYPYLGAGFQFQPREGTGAGYLRHIYCFNPAARLSFDHSVSDVASNTLQPVLISAIAQDLFAEGIDVAASKRVLDAGPPPPPDPAAYQRAIRA